MMIAARNGPSGSRQTKGAKQASLSVRSSPEYPWRIIERARQGVMESCSLWVFLILTLAVRLGALDGFLCSSLQTSRPSRTVYKPVLRRGGLQSLVDVADS